ncbi:MAG: hypothetical protein COA67_07135 [Lutibacter sp.]|nr:MAG: hypothetical protein COA67_07135 [Lutibacter sp.]
MTTQDLNSSEFNEYYNRYIDKLSTNLSLIEGYKTGKNTVLNFFKSIPNDKLEYRYASGKWTVKEVLQHLIDTERIFMYRCFRIARRDTTSLVGYDQDIYIEPSKANNKSIEELLNEFEINRNNSIAIINSLSDDDLKFVGVSSESPLSARAAAFIILGHDIWHMEVIKERYL